MIQQKIELWPQKLYPSERGNGSRPTIDTYILSGAKKRGAVLICPGGGYSFISEREGEPIAIQFNAAGFHAFVLNYSVASHRHPQPLLDLSRAMCIIHENAEIWNIEPEKIVVCGFSAGGHLAASLGVHWEKPYLQDAPGINKGKNKPNALILCYPVITSGQFAHRDSFINLLGKQAGEELLFEMSLEHHVNDKTPPAFIWHTYDDGLVPAENSLLFAQAMHQKGIPVELHIYPKGPHGLSLATSETENGAGIYPHISTWLGMCSEWLKELFYC